MCDEYYDARMKAFWRSLAESETEETLETKDDELIVHPIVLDSLEPQKPKAKALVR